MTLKKFVVSLLIAASFVFGIEKARAFASDGFLEGAAAVAAAAVIAKASASSAGLVTAGGAVVTGGAAVAGVGLAPLIAGVGAIALGVYFIYDYYNDPVVVSIPTRTVDKEVNPDLSVVPSATPSSSYVYVTPKDFFSPTGSLRRDLYLTSPSSFTLTLPRTDSLNSSSSYRSREEVMSSSDASFKLFWLNLESFLSRGTITRMNMVSNTQTGCYPLFSYASGTKSTCLRLIGPGFGESGYTAYPSPEYQLVGDIYAYGPGYSLATSKPGGSNEYAFSLFILYTAEPTELLSCPAGTTYAPSVGACIDASATIAEADGVCNLSWSATDGNPLWNPYDPDCVKVPITVSPGTATTPPSVDIRSPSGEVIRTERPHLPTQGTPGETRTYTAKPDPATGTTIRDKVVTTPPAQGALPVVGQAGTTRTTGETGTPDPVSPGAGASPVNSVQVSNWPQGLDKLAGWLEVIAVQTRTIANAPPPQFPDRLKIDMEDDDSGIDEDLVDQDSMPDLAGLFDPIRDAVAGFMSVELPAHQSECPVIDIDVEVWGEQYDVLGDWHCTWTLQHKDMLQALFSVLWLILAIRILLDT